MRTLRPTDSGGRLQRSVAACLAAILEVDVAEVPVPDEEHPEPWTVWRNWLAQRGLGLVPIAEPASFNALVGERFAVGGVECIGRRLCEPCAHLERLTPGTLRPLIHKGGLRADVLADGEIRAGDPIAAG